VRLNDLLQVLKTYSDWLQFGRLSYHQKYKLCLKCICVQVEITCHTVSCVYSSSNFTLVHVWSLLSVGKHFH